MEKLSHPYPIGTKVIFLEDIPEQKIEIGMHGIVDEEPGKLDHLHIYEPGTYGYLLVTEFGDIWAPSYKIEAIAPQ